MKSQPYTYCVIRYSPDPGAGEMLNVGVVVLGQESGDLYWKLEERYERLSATFAGFHGRPYRACLDQLSHTLEALRAAARAELLVSVSPDYRALKSSLAVLTNAIPDVGLGFNVSELRGGIAEDLVAETNLLFERMVTSRRAARAEPQNRSNEQVWKGVYEPKIPPDVRARLQEKTFLTPDVEVHFDHAYKNGSWHVVQPLSLDYKTPDTIRKHASEWAGTSIGLSGASDLGIIYFLVGEPRIPALRDTYEKAIRLLDKSPIRHEIVEEKDALAFADRLSDIVRHTS